MAQNYLGFKRRMESSFQMSLDSWNLCKGYNLRGKRGMKSVDFDPDNNGKWTFFFFFESYIVITECQRLNNLEVRFQGLWVQSLYYTTF